MNSTDHYFDSIVNYWKKADQEISAEENDRTQKI